MKLMDKLLSRRYIDWDEYQKKMKAIEDKHWDNFLSQRELVESK